MKKNTHHLLVWMIGLGGLGGLLLPSPSCADAFTDVMQPIFSSHCIQCHGKDGKVKGKLNLLEIKSLGELAANPELLENLIDVIDFQEMPPEDEPQFSEVQRLAILAAFEDLLEGADKAMPQAPIRRMNRFQYNNAVIDLFALDRVVFQLPERMLRGKSGYFDPEKGKMPQEVIAGSRPLGKSQLIEPRLNGVGPFPQDLRAEHGYDNRGDHLSMSTMLLESFLELSQSIVQSDDFGPRTVGIWHAFFADPYASDPNPKPDPESSEADPVPSEAEKTALLETRIEPFLTRAFRRPVSTDLLNRYVAHALGELNRGVRFTDVMKEIASAAIASPRFLYLYDAGSDAGSALDPVRLNDYDLASRLSFFVWGSIPDQALLDLAEAGTLSDEAVLDAQIDRMLMHKRSQRFCDRFPAQWLQLERLISSVPDRNHFPQFYFSKYRMSMYFMLEPLLLFETVYLENRSILEFIDSDYAYWSDPLKKSYEKPKEKAGGNPTKIPFKRIALTDRRRGGLITTAATMTMTSGPEHSNPITRGAWLLTVFFNDPPDPAPADVPALDEKPPPGEENLTLRERLSAHRERADCAGCHEKIDPLGFALENYGPTGIWRDSYENGRKIDMQGELFRSRKFENIIEFKDAILAEKDRFARAFSEHVMSYALAREIAPADSGSIDKIAAAVIADDFRLHTVIKEVIKSDSFQLKATPQTKPK